MALFRQHISLKAILAVAGVILLYFYALTTDPLALTCVFGLCTLGSILPDVDSDSGLPFYLMFGTLTVGFGGAVLYLTLSDQPNNKYILVGVPLASLAFFWVLAGGIFRRFTHHRGIWHSIPALLIAAFAVYDISRHSGVDMHTALILASAMGAGFLSHLVLDEIYSEIDLGGIPFIPKRSLGTALKLFSRSRWVNVLAYAILGALVYIALYR